MLAYTYSLSGKRSEALRIFDDLAELSKRRYISPYSIAIVHTGLGEEQAAFHCLEKAFQERASWLAFLKVDPLWDSLRASGEFSDLMRRVGLE